MSKADKRNIDLRRKRGKRERGNRDIKDLHRILSNIVGEEEAKQKMKEFGFEQEIEDEL